jgi:hypothetical protein
VSITKSPAPARGNPSIGKESHETASSRTSPESTGLAFFSGEGVRGRAASLDIPPDDGAGASPGKGGFVAKKKAKKTPQQFLTDLATDPEKLGNFILDPEGSMDDAGIGKKDRAHVKSGVAHFVNQKLVKPPDAFFVF